MPDLSAHLPALLDRLERAALVDAARLVGDLAAAGTPVPRLVDELLVPAQVEVGQRWASNRWTVAQEHAATAIIETLLTTASVRARVPEPGPGAPSVVLVCAEGEWHALAARMAAESLRASGVAVTFLGPSLPAEVLGDFLRDVGPTALGVSCSLSFALPGSLRCVEAAHDAGVPALAAGRAFGGGPQRASRLGFDGWVAGVADGVELLRQWQGGAPGPAAPALPAQDEWRRLPQAPSTLADAALRALLARHPRLEAFSPALVDRLRKDVQYSLRYAAAAQLVDDPSVLGDHAAWLTEVLTARSVPREVVADLHECTGAALAEGYPACAALFRDVAASLRPLAAR